MQSKPGLTAPAAASAARYVGVGVIVISAVLRTTEASGMLNG
jgi:hypothetical protein